MQKKTIIAVAVAALMTGAAWAQASGTTKYAGEGASIAFSDASVDSGEKIIGGWNYAALGSSYDHAGADTDITLTAGKYDPQLPTVCYSPVPFMLICVHLRILGHHLDFSHFLIMRQ